MTDAAVSNIGPHLLGRIRTERDERDYPLEAVEEGVTALDLALAAVQKSKITGTSVKAWAKLITAVVQGTTPAPVPVPPPTPVPTPTPVGPVNGVWPDNEVALDQGQTNHCVGFGGSQFENILPVDDKKTAADGHALYYLCKVKDGEPLQEDGSSVHSLAKVLQDEARVAAYAWATDTDTMIKWLSSQGPITIGIDWTDDMFNPDANNYIAPTGALAGGHCLNVDGYIASEDAFDLLNSWGPTWGDNGHVKMKVSDFKTLLDGLDPKYPGEAMAAIELPL